MPEYLEKSRLKVVRANEHIANIEAESAGFFASEPYTLLVEPDPDTSGQEIHKLRLNKPVPDIIEHLTIEAAHHLRTALDNACHAVAVASGIDKPRIGECAFPFPATLQTSKTT
jgi:hypothetical protein